MSGFRSLKTAQGGFIEAFPTYFREGRAARVDVVETAVRGAIDEDGAVKLRDQGEGVEGGDGVDGVVCCGHVGGKGWGVSLVVFFGNGRLWQDFTGTNQTEGEAISRDRRNCPKN